MKFPIATVTLVSAALIFVVWNQTRDKPDHSDASRFQDLSSNPAERSDVVDWVITRIPSLCAEATGNSGGSEAYSDCIERGQSRTSTCRRSVYDAFPDMVTSEAVFRDISITMMNCLVPQSGLIDPSRR